MSSIDLITSLPTCLSCSVLCEWLRLKSLARLDSAYCSRTSRSFFLELMRSRECVSEDMVIISTPRLLEWLLVRELQVSRLRLSCVRAQLTKYLLRNATAFKELVLTTKVFKYFQKLKFTNLIALTCTLHLNSCAFLANIPKLRMLTVTLQLGSGDVMNFESGILLKLDHLDVGCYDQLPGGSILAVVRMTRSLRHLSLQMLHNAISHREWVSIAKCCPQLRTLSVFANNLSDATLGEFCRLCPLITTMNIDAFGSSITDAGVLIFAQCLYHLQFLKLEYCQQLTDLSLVHIATHCEELRTFSLLNCPLVTPSALVKLQERLQLHHSP